MQLSKDITDHKLRKELEHIVDTEGFDCIEVQVQRSRNTRLLRVVVYRKENMDVAALEKLTRGIQFNLPVVTNSDEKVLEHFSLEVSSPGTNRVLRTSREYGIFVGKFVRLLRNNSETWEEGMISNATDSTVTLQMNEKSETISIDTIRRAQLIDREGR